MDIITLSTEKTDVDNNKNYTYTIEEENDTKKEPYTLYKEGSEIKNDFALIKVFLEQKAETTQKSYRIYFLEFFSFLYSKNIDNLGAVTSDLITKFRKVLELGDIDTSHMENTLAKQQAAATVIDNATVTDNIAILIKYGDKVRRKRKPLADATIATRLNALGGLYTYGVKFGYFKRNPFLLIRKPKLDHMPKDKFLTDEQIELIRKELLYPLKKGLYKDDPGHPLFRRIIFQRNYLIFRLFIFTGLRVSELASAKWKHISVNSNNKRGLRVKGKGSRYRTVKINEELWCEFDKYRSLLYQRKVLNITDESNIFLSKSYTPLTPSGVRQVVETVSTAAGIEKKVTPHWLRHTSASKAIQGGADIKLVMAQYGWTNLNTPNRYIHLTKGLDETASDKINIIF